MLFLRAEQESFDHVNDWLNEVNRYASEGTCKLLVGNKSDISENRAVSYEAAKAFADSLAIPFLETSAKNAQNVEEAFLTMASELITIREMVGDTSRPKGATVRVAICLCCIAVDAKWAAMFLTNAILSQQLSEDTHKGNNNNCSCN